MSQLFYVYILLCGDQTLYTGITTDLVRRLSQHQSGRGARYTRAKGVQQLLYQEGPYSHSEALKRELAIKKLSRSAKEKLIENRNLEDFSA